MNINSVFKSITKNPVHIFLLIGAFGAGYVVAQKLLVQQASANAAIPQYSSESEVQYPRYFEGYENDYTDPSGYTTPPVMGLDDNGSGVAIPRVSNSFYDEVLTDNGDDYYMTDDITEVADYY